MKCLSCERENLRDAKFCQECGAPLNLKLCGKCEAVNNAAAAACHACQSAFDVNPVKAVVAGRRRLALAGGSAAALAIAAGVAWYMVDSRPAAHAGVAAREAPSVQSPVAAPSAPEQQLLPAPEPAAAATPVPVQRVSRNAPSQSIRPEARSPVARPQMARPGPVTHTRNAAAPAAQPEPSAQAAPAPAVIPVPINDDAKPVPVTHTKRAAAPTKENQ